MPSGETIEILYGNLISFMHFHSGFCFHEFNLAGCFGAGKARLIHCKKTNPELRNALKRGLPAASNLNSIHSSFFLLFIKSAFNLGCRQEMKAGLNE